jgi:mannose/fructose/N-acetylgalactosamine-specific phosphotransferase system component IIC
VGLVGIILTVIYSELEGEEAPDQEQAPEEEAQDEAREDLAGP